MNESRTTDQAHTISSPDRLKTNQTPTRHPLYWIKEMNLSIEVRQKSPLGINWLNAYKLVDELTCKGASV